MIFVISACHSLVGVNTHVLHLYHVLFRMLYLLPIIAAAVWFHLQGSMLAALAVSIFYSIHVATAWGGRPMENANQFAMVGVYWLLALVAGVLSTLEARERKLAEEATRRKDVEAMLTALESLSQALRWRDSYTQQHSENVVVLAEALARRMGLEEKSVQSLRLAARIHDIGKIGVRDDILFKPDELSPEEREIMERHPIVAAEIVSRIPGIDRVAAIVRAHHECPDGTGYPQGLLREQIPREALILSVADAFSALTEDRPYRQGTDARRALGTIQSMAGDRFDRHAVMALESMLHADSGAGLSNMSIRTRHRVLPLA